MNNYHIAHSVLKRIDLDNVFNGVSARENTTVAPSDNTTVPSVRADQSTNLHVRYAFGSSNFLFKSGSLVQMHRPNPEISRQSGFTQTLET